MPRFYLTDETHTLASALRPCMESLCPDEFVACTHMHHLDSHVEVEAPSEAALRRALLMVREQIAAARAAMQTCPRPSPCPAA